MMSQVPLAKDHERAIDDAHFLNEAVNAYKTYLSGPFTDGWPEAYERYRDTQQAINLVTGEIDAPEGAVTLVRDYEAGLDDAHYLNFAVTEAFDGRMSARFSDAWAEAHQSLQGGEPIDLIEGATVGDDRPEQLPEIGYDLPDPPKPQPTQLPADQPKPEQY